MKKRGDKNKQRRGENEMQFRIATLFIRLLDSALCIRNRGVEIKSSVNHVFINYVLSTNRND